MKLALARAGLFLLAAAAGTGCVSVDWSRTQRYHRIERSVVRELVPGQDDLTSCLQRFGAPLYVFEEPDGAALAWGWFESQTVGLGFSVPVAESASASIDLQDVDRSLEGVVLFFDANWKLRFARRGKLAEISSRPPSLTVL